MKPSVLVVEAAWTIGASIQSSLVALGYDVHGACSSGADVVARVALHRPSVVLMDICLKSDVDGIEVARRIRSDCRVPVVFLTAFRDDATLDGARRANPEGFLLRPFDQPALKGAIETAMLRFQADQEVLAPATVPPTVGRAACHGRPSK